MPNHQANWRSGHRILALLLVSSTALIDIFTTVRADDASDRQNLLRDIDDKLRRVDAELSGVRSEDDDDDIKSAERLIDDVRDLLNKLQRVAGDDAKAKEVVERFPRYIEKFKASTKALSSMKDKQRSNANVKKTCEDSDKSLVEKARDFERRGDPQGLEKLPQLAGDAKQDVIRALEDAGRVGSDIEQWKYKVQEFDINDGEWSDIRSTLRRESDGIRDDWREGRRTAEDACKDVKGGVEHPVVREILARLANSAEGRKGAIERLDRLVGELAGKIKVVADAPNSAALDGVREKLNAIDDLLKDLEKTRDADATAKGRVEVWPRIVTDAREALRPLSELKVSHYTLDDAAVRCRTRTTDLQNFISRNGTGLRGLVSIPEFAEELRTQVQSETEDFKRRLEKLQAAHDQVLRFSRSEQRWSEVTTAYRATADKVLDHIKAKHRDFASDCADFTRPVHPKVEAALDRLYGHLDSVGDDLERAIEEWVRVARDTYRLDCEGMREMSQAYCREDWDPNDGIDPDARAKTVAATLQDSMQKKIHGVLDLRDALVDRLNALKSEPATRKRVETLVRMLEKEKGRLERLQTARVWRGTNHPFKFFVTEYGKAMHKIMHGRYQCSVPLTSDSQVTFTSGSHTKPDCITLQGCKIYEFKPDSDTGQADGARQVTEYEKLVNDHYNEAHRLNKNEDKFGGMGFLKRLEEKCLDKGVFRLKAEVAYYDSSRCQMVYECLDERD